MKDYHNDMKAVRALSPVNIADNTATATQIIDRAGFEGLEVVFAPGSILDADATFAITGRHGNVANLSDATALTDADLLGTLAGAAYAFDSDNQTRKLGYKGNKRYVEFTVTPSNNTTLHLGSCLALLFGPLKGPQSSQS